VLFIEFRFLVFLAVVLAVYWLLGRSLHRKLWLLGCSYFFYAAWDWRFLSLILLSTCIDYVAGMRITSLRGPKGRRRWMLVSVIGNLSILGFFKYFNFFADSLSDLARVAGLSVGHSTLEIVLPVGISFYTFQTMSYTLDIYAGKLKASKSVLDVALFVAFFPQLVAGPIVRAREFLPQLRSARLFGDVEVRACLMLFLTGFVKKGCVADNLSPLVDAYFAAPHTYNALSAWIAILLYSVQIYCDFSGYSDMAIASAGLLGFRIPANFRAPYLASSISDFWHRWHISLSTWLRDYLYIPLGGSRCSKLCRYRNLMITMLLGGLWHGAAWRFVAWGGLHGTALVAHQEWGSWVPEGSRARRICAMLGPGVTFYWVCLTWIFFRASGFGQAMEILRAFALFQSSGTETLNVGLLGVFVFLAALHRISATRSFASWWRRVPVPAFSAAYGALFALAIALVPLGHKPFIYFQF
jgi:alginate O-acetyltransferase complex protein AlgI